MSSDIKKPSLIFQMARFPLGWCDLVFCLIPGFYGSDVAEFLLLNTRFLLGRRCLGTSVLLLQCFFPLGSLLKRLSRVYRFCRQEIFSDFSNTRFSLGWWIFECFECFENMWFAQDFVVSMLRLRIVFNISPPSRLLELGSVTEMPSNVSLKSGWTGLVVRLWRPQNLNVFCTFYSVFCTVNYF